MLLTITTEYKATSVEVQDQVCEGNNTKDARDKETR